LGFGIVFGSPFALRFAGTREFVVADEGAGAGLGARGGAGAREDCRELSLDIASTFGAGGGREGFRGFDSAGVGVGCGAGSGAALDKILEKAIGSAGLLGVYEKDMLDKEMRSECHGGN
jgi:hypothetical protein